MDTHADETKLQNTQAKRKRRLTALTLLFALAAAAAGSAFFLWWQHEEETEDAYVAGRVVQVTPQKGGTVRKVLHDDTDAVKKATCWRCWTTIMMCWLTSGQKTS